MTSRSAYPSDLSDARWADIEPRLTAWRQSRAAAGVSGRTPTHDLREIFNAILYLNRTGIPWRYLPHDFPPYRTVYRHFAAWSKEGLFTELNYELTGLVRDHHGRQIEPTASIMDTQSVKTSTNVPAVTRAPTRARRSSAASAGSSPTPSACCSLWSSPRPASVTT
jgi:transposase